MTTKPDELREKPKKFVLSSRKMVLNKHHARSWAELRLFYGVPQWAKYWYRSAYNDDIIFTNIEENHDKQT